MSNLFEDYREIANVRDKLDLLIELVHTAPRRVFITQQGEVQAVILSPRDYTDLWQLEFDRDMARGDEEVARGEVFTTEEVLLGIDRIRQEVQAKRK
jgi:PHD/YefM family antitoxin component YafN of YafNO toxin-antitoxin module